MEINKFVEQKIEKIALTIGFLSKKIIKKELRKMPKDMIKRVIKNGRS